MGRKKTIDDETLLTAARKIFVTQGSGATIKQIALAAGISEAAIIQRHATKADLYMAAMTPPFIDPKEIIANEIADTRAALIETGYRLLNHLRQLIPVGLQIAAAPESGLADLTRHFPPERLNAHAVALTGFIAERTARGEIATQSPGMTARLLIAAIHSLAVYEQMGLHGGQKLDSGIPGFIDALWDGLAPTKSVGKE